MILIFSKSLSPHKHVWAANAELQLKGRALASHKNHTEAQMSLPPTLLSRSDP